MKWLVLIGVLVVVLPAAAQDWNAFFANKAKGLREGFETDAWVWINVSPKGAALNMEKAKVGKLTFQPHPQVQALIDSLQANPHNDTAEFRRLKEAILAHPHIYGAEATYEDRKSNEVKTLRFVVGMGGVLTRVQLYQDSTLIFTENCPFDGDCYAIKED